MVAQFDRKLVRQRAEALSRFSDWEARHPTYLDAAAAVAAIGFLYDQLPPEGRVRTVDVSGIQCMRRVLAVLSS